MSSFIFLESWTNMGPCPFSLRQYCFLILGLWFWLWWLIKITHGHIVHVYFKCGKIVISMNSIQLQSCLPLVLTCLFLSNFLHELCLCALLSLQRCGHFLVSWLVHLSALITHLLHLNTNYSITLTLLMENLASLIVCFSSMASHGSRLWSRSLLVQKLCIVPDLDSLLAHSLTIFSQTSISPPPDSSLHILNFIKIRLLTWFLVFLL